MFWRNIQKAISILVIFCLMIQQVPVYALDFSVFSNGLDEEKIKKDDIKTLYEITSKREEDKKYFKMSDGSEKVNLYAAPVHFKENGKYVDVDNELIKIKDTYENKKASYKVRYQAESNNNLLKLEKDGYSLSMSLILEKLKEKLETPQPEEKKVRPYKFFDCGWKKNDVFAYQLKSEYAKKAGIYDYWFIFIVDDSYVWEDHYVLPIVRAKITKDTELPKNEEEIDKLDYIQIASEYYDSVFDPLWVRFRSKEEIEYNNSMKDKLLKYGVLPIYRFTIDNSSKRIIPKTLKYLGNYKNIRLPEDEYIEIIKVNIWGVLWKYLEELIVGRYVGYNVKGKNYRWGEDDS